MSEDAKEAQRVVLNMDKRKLSLSERSPLARRILRYLRAQDPPMPEAEFARRIGVSRQAFHNWMWNISVPDAQNIISLAAFLRCTVEDLKADIDASRAWRPPMPFPQFVALVEAQATSENWSDKEQILPPLRFIITANWQDTESKWVEMARDLLTSHLSLREKATRLALIVQAQQALNAGP